MPTLTLSELHSKLLIEIIFKTMEREAEHFTKLHEEHKHLLQQDGLNEFDFDFPLDKSNAHPKVQEKVNTWLEYNNVLKQELKDINLFLTKAFNEAECPGELYELLPDSLHGILRSSGIDPSPMPEFCKQEILRIGQKGYELIPIRMLRNILDS